MTHYDEITIGLAQYSLVLDRDDGFTYPGQGTTTTITTNITDVSTTTVIAPTTAATGTASVTTYAVKVICGVLSLAFWF